MISRYDPQRGDEYDRLRIQAERARELDRSTIGFGLDRIGRDGLLALDVGCGDGFVTTTLLDFEQVDRAVGIDKSEYLIEKARSRASKRLSFRRMDIESPTTEDELNEVAHEFGRERFDLVLAMVSLHHLSEGDRVLRTLRRLLAPDGFLAARAKDDGARLAYPDTDDRVARTIEETKNSPGVSERHGGRKLYSQLRSAGFEEIRMFPSVIHTIGMGPEERHRLFLESFSYRRNYLAQAAERDPSDGEAHRRLRRIDDDLAAIERDFESDAFFYLEVVFGFVAFAGSGFVSLADQSLEP